MRDVWLTAWREFKATVMTKAFIIGAVVVPVGFYAVLGVAIWAGIFETKRDPLVGTIAVMDATPGRAIESALADRVSPERQQAERDAQDEAVREAMRDAMGEDMARMAEQQAQSSPMASALEQVIADITIEAVDAGASIDEVKQRVRRGELLALVIVGPETLRTRLDARADRDAEADDAPTQEVEPDTAGEAALALSANTFDVFFGENVKATDRDQVEDAVQDAVIDVRVDPLPQPRAELAALLASPRAQARSITAAGESAGSGDLLRFIPFGFMLLLFIAIFTGAQYLMMSTIEEKSSRVMEVLLSATTATKLMTGKIVGQGFVGLVIVVLYGGAALAALVTFADASYIDPGLIAWQVFYFITGYFMFASIFAAVGAAVTEIKEAQALQGPLIGGVVLAFYITAILAFTNPDSPIVQVLAFVPPLSPLVMSMRVAQIGDPTPLWQLIGTTLVCIVGTIAFVWAAAKIFRVGSLMYGKPPSLGTLVKWIRYS